MKKVLLIILLITFSGFYSCEDTLKEEIYGKTADANFWNTQKDAETAIKAAYSSIRGGWSGLSFWQFVIEDMGTEIGTGGYFGTTDYTSYTGWSPTTPDFVSWGLWSQFWKGVNYTNTVLDKVPEMEFDAKAKNRILGEAHAVRAMIYFYMVNWFGGMPEITTATEAPLVIPRQSVESNYALIEADLTKAIELLPLKSELVSMNEQDYGRVTKGAAQALLARAYLQQKKWQQAADASLKVINSQEYALELNYMNIFSMSNEGFKNKEVIWVLPFIAGTSPAINACVLQVYLYRAPEISAYSQYYDWNGDIRVTTLFYNSFDKADLRRKGLFSSTADTQTDPVMLLKYPSDPASEGAHSGTDYPFIRYADVLLMRAEALAQLNDVDGSIAEVNKVRARAGLAALDKANFTAVSLVNQIYKERKWEFYFEGHAKRDKIRMDYSGMIEYIKSKSTDWETVTAERYLLLPIPARATASNPGMTQNPGF